VLPFPARLLVSWLAGFYWRTVTARQTSSLGIQLFQSSKPVII